MALPQRSIEALKERKKERRKEGEGRKGEKGRMKADVLADGLGSGRHYQMSSTVVWEDKLRVHHRT